MGARKSPRRGQAGCGPDSERSEPFVDIVRFFAEKWHQWASTRRIEKQTLFQSKWHHRRPTRARLAGAPLAKSPPASRTNVERQPAQSQAVTVCLRQDTPFQPGDGPEADRRGMDDQRYRPRRDFTEKLLFNSGFVIKMFVRRPESLIWAGRDARVYQEICQRCLLPGGSADFGCRLR